MQDGATLPALTLHAFELDNATPTGSAIVDGGAYRVRSDVPVVAYQFNPLDVGIRGVEDGVHVLNSTEPFAVVAMGYLPAGAYAFLGGTGTALINPAR